MISIRQQHIAWCLHEKSYISIEEDSYGDDSLKMFRLYDAYDIVATLYDEYIVI